MSAWVERIGQAALEAAALAGLPVVLSPLAAGAALLALVAAIALLVLTGLVARLAKRARAEAASPPRQSHPEVTRPAAPNVAPQPPRETVTAPVQAAPSPARTVLATSPAPTTPPQLPSEAILRPFISYSRKDADFAEAVFAALEARGHAPIIDRKGIDPNEPWQERLDELILQSDAVVFLLSPDWLQSEVCRWELRCAEGHGKLFAPVQFGALDIKAVPQQLSRRNFVSFEEGWPVVENNQSAFGAAIDWLIKGLRITQTLWRRGQTKWMARAEAWRAVGMPEDRLAPPGETAEIQQWVSEKPVDEDALPPLLLQFINASVAAAGKLKQIETAVVGQLDVIDGFASLPPDHVRRLPTALVVADYGIIPFDDSRGLLAELLAWARDPALTGPAGRLYAAAGGYGKTRLALQAIAMLKAEGWRTGLLPRAALKKVNVRGEQDGDERLARFFAGRGDKGAFLALDYAEGRTAQIERVTRAALAAPKGGPIRIMLLARGAGDWWNGLLDSQRDLERVFDRKAFGAIGGDIAPDQRTAFFRAAAQAFAQWLGAAQAADDLLLRPDWQTAPIPERRLAAAEAGSPLSLAFEAFLHVRGVALEGSPLAEMAREERRHWARALKRKAADGAATGDPRLEALHRCAAVVTLGGGFGPAPDDAVDAKLKQTLATALKAPRGLDGDDIARAEALAAVRAGLDDLYRTRRADGDVLSPILPDLLGERLVAEAIARAPGLVADVLDSGDVDKISAFIVLNRISRLTVEIGTNAPPVHDPALVEATQDALQTALSSRLAVLADPLVAAVNAENGKAHEPSLAALNALAPEPMAKAGTALLRAQQRRMNINAVPARLRALFGKAAEAASKAHPLSPTQDQDTSNRDQGAADAYARATAMSNSGDLEGALAAAQEAVALFRALALENPQAFTPNLAESVSKLAICLSNAGDRPGALAAAQEAVALRRALALQNPQAFTQDLAASVSNLANFLSNWGDRQGGLAAAQEAVSLRRALAKGNPQAFTPELARSVSNLALRLSETGDRQGSLAAAQEAVAFSRALALKSPQAFTHYLAGMVTNLAKILSEAGDRPGALAAAQEAVALYRALASENPQAFTPDLAKSISNLESRLSEAGDRQGALAAAQEAVALFRALALENPQAFTPNLAESVSNLAVRLAAVGDRQGALAAAQESAALTHALAKGNPQAFLPELARSLSILALRLSEADDHEGAMAAAQNAVALYRDLAEENPQAFTLGLAISVSNLAVSLSAAGDRQGALAAAQEAVALCRALADGNPQPFTPYVAGSLSNLTNFLADAGDLPGALAAAQEAVALFRALAVENPQAFNPDLARSISDLASRFSEAGDRQGALAALKEAVALRRELAKDNPRAFMPDLAMSLGAYGQTLLNGGSAAEARSAMEAFLEGAMSVEPLIEGMSERFSRLFQNLVRDYVRAARAAGGGETELAAMLAALGERLGDSGVDQPLIVALFWAWAEAHNEQRKDDAHAAYAQLCAALDAAGDNPELDPVRDSIAQARAKIGDGWTYGELPLKG